MFQQQYSKCVRALIFACLLCLALSSSALAQCTDCLKLGLTGSQTLTGVLQNTLPSSLPADSPTPDGSGFYNLTASSSTAANIPNKVYNAWCASPGKTAPIGGRGLSFAASSTFATSFLPSPVSNEINYIVNHKPGYTITEVQDVIWAVILHSSATLNAHETTLYTAATDPLGAGPTFIPGPGQIITVFLHQSSTTFQDFLIELRNPCVAVGDFVWFDQNNNGTQDASETGINGVTVQLTDALGHSLTTVTGPSPIGYTPVRAAGYYQFIGLCAGTYTITVPTGTTQPALAGYNLTATLVPPADTDSNLNPATVTIPSGSNETIDFGFTTSSPLALTCSATGTSGEMNVPFYGPALNPTGGTPSYTFSVVGTLPAGLTLNPLTGAVTGTPLASGAFSIEVKDANNQVAATTCPYTIVAPPSLACSATSSGEQGVPFNIPAMSVTGGVAPLTFSVASGTLPPGLTLNPSNGAITGTPTGSGYFTIKVTDANNQVALGNCPFTIQPPPSLACSAPTTASEVGVPFNSPGMTVTGGVGSMTFSIATGSLPAGLILNTATGAITGTPQSAGSFTLKVTDSNGQVATGTCPFVIQDGPSLACAAPTTASEVGVPFNSPAMSVTGGVGSMTFSVATGSLPAGLNLNPSTGAITGTPQSAGSFTLKVTDANGAVATGTCPFVIQPGPALACAAPTTASEVGVPFNIPAMTVTGGVGSMTFSIATGSLPAGLNLNPSTGAITGTPLAAGSFTLKVIDANGAVAAGTCPFNIAPAPSLACAAPTTASEVGVPFNSPAMTVTGGVGSMTFSVATGALPNGLILNTATGAITGTPLEAGQFTLKVTDSNGQVATGNCPFTISPAPSLACSAPTTASEVGVPFNSPAMTVTGGVGSMTFSVATGSLPAGLTLNPSTGAISGTPQSAGSFTLKVTDANGQVATGTCPFVIQPGPALACAAPTTASEVGVPFNSPAMTVTGGVGSMTFSIATGALPAGLTLNPSTGAISGTPTAAGSFTLKVTDSNGAVATGTCPFTISPAPALACSAPTTAAEVGVPFNSPAMTVTGGVGSMTFSIATGALPNGLILNTATGAISGTPLEAGQFTLKVTDSNGQVATGNCPFTISPAPSLACSAPTTASEVGVPFNSPAMTVTGGVGSMTFSIATGSLPAGLTLNPSTGAITGTPLAAGSFTLKVTDANGQVATGTCPFVIQPGPALACAAPTTASEVGVPFNSPAMSVSGGIGPFAFSIATGALPAGLTLNTSTGAITGTPQTAGQFTIKVTDHNGAVATGTCPFTIMAGPSVTCSAVNTGKVGVAFNSPAMTVNGGLAPYTFSIATGALPAGLTLNAQTGAITGTPLAAGSFTLKITDSNGSVAGSTCGFTIAPSPVLLTCSAVNTGTVGAQFNSPAMTISGGVAPYGFSLASGALPSILNLNPSNGAISGTPLAAGSFTIKVTDSTGAVAAGTCPFSITWPVTGVQVGRGDTATIGYWQNKNGQALINALNGGPTSTTLANWLATTYPYLYGPSSPNNLTNKTNADVASLFLVFFNVSGTKTQAQVMAGAIATYVTSTAMAGTVAAQYGFNTSMGGTGVKFYSVGSYGSEIGLADNGSYTVQQLLAQANLMTTNGTFDANAFNVIFSGINQSGDIK